MSLKDRLSKLEVMPSSEDVRSDRLKSLIHERCTELLGNAVFTDEDKAEGKRIVQSVLAYC